MPLIFKLKAPHEKVAGFGFFSILPTRLAWDVYGDLNGAPEYATFRQALTSIRRGHGITTDPKHDFAIGCVLLTRPVFFERDLWIESPDDFRRGTVQWKGYDLTSGEGKRVWMECLARAGRMSMVSAASPSSIADRPILGGYGAPVKVRPRLGQRSFRVAVLDTYDRKCSVTNERTLPALEAAHIREYHQFPEHSVNNGILLRADIHKLFDTGYVTVTPDYHFEVSQRIKEEFENGRDYCRLHGTTIRLPTNPEHRPLLEALSWHNEKRFLG